MTARILFPLLCSLLAFNASAQESACPGGNLLRDRPPSLYDGVERVAAITDGARAHEGAFWNTPVTGVLDSESSFLVYDLGRLVRVDAFYVQTDNNDTLEIYGSRDGVRYQQLWTVPAVDGQGMRSRSVRGLAAQLQWLRIAGARGDGFFSIGELQAFCSTPASWPPDMPRVGDDPQLAQTPAGRLERWWDDRETRLSAHKIVIGLFGLVAILGFMTERTGRKRFGSLLPPASAAAALAYTIGLTFGPALGALLALVATVFLWWKASAGSAKRSERPALLALLLVGALTWSNFGTFHGIREVHLWDFMHYYLGSKYFEESGYRWFYHCALAAETEDGRGEEVRGRKYRNLTNNRLGPSELIAAEAMRVCHENFSDQRWQAFRQDLRIFRDLMSPGWFAEAFQDHGYNASPAWTAVGSPISNLGWDQHLPPPELAFSLVNLEGATQRKAEAILDRFVRNEARLYRRITWLARIDAALYAGVFALIVWAFGLRAGAVAIIAWSVGHPWAYYWTGGSFGRVPWLFSAVAGLCLLKRGYAGLGGAGLAGSLLLRVFPAALAGGVALRFCSNAATERRIDPTHLRILAGALATLAVWGALSVASGGLDAWPRFISNSLKHRETPLTNHMGLPTLVAYQPSHAGRHLKDSAEDPFAHWKEMRRSLLEGRSVWLWGIVLATVATLVYVVRTLEDWEATSLATLLVFCLFDLTCYYLVYLVLLAPFCLRRASYVAALIATAIATQVASLTVSWTDERYVLESAMIGLLLVYVLGSEVIRVWRRQVGFDAPQ
jgi:hypothetical protein